MSDWRVACVVRRHGFYVYELTKAWNFERREVAMREITEDQRDEAIEAMYDALPDRWKNQDEIEAVLDALLALDWGPSSSGGRTPIPTGEPQ